MCGHRDCLRTHRRGAKAIIVDGVVTDIVELREAGLPVFARGTSLLTTRLRSDPGSAMGTCGAATVRPGDWVLADNNGVLIASDETLGGVIGLALANDAAEPLSIECIRNGEPLEQLLKVLPQPG